MLGLGVGGWQRQRQRVCARRRAQGAATQRSSPCQARQHLLALPAPPANCVCPPQPLYLENLRCFLQAMAEEGRQQQGTSPGDAAAAVAAAASPSASTEQDR